MAANTDIVGAYYPYWNAAVLPPERIPNYFTHVFYAFAKVNSANSTLAINPETENSMRNFTSKLRSRNAPPKIFLSIGGYSDEESANFSRMASSGTSRGDFIRSTIDAARRLGFDGLDLDWEYPETPQEMSHFSALLREWHQAAAQDSSQSRRPRLILSAAVYFRPDFWYKGPPVPVYPAAAVKDYLDFVCVMCYDYHGKWEPMTTGQHALLYDRAAPAVCTSYAISSWIEAGVPANKLVMGLPLYGKTWRLKDPNNHGIRAPADGVGPGNQGDLSYDEIIQFNRRASRVYDEATVSVYSYSGTDWVGYDGPESVEEKIKFAKSKRLGGFFFWALGMDNGFVLPQRALNTWNR